MAQAAIAVGSAGLKLFGGLFAASQAKARGAFFAKQYEEQAKSVNIMYQRAIQRSIGAEATQGMGVSTESRISSMLDSAYTASLEKVAKEQDLYRAATQAKITGQIQATSAISEGAAGAFGSLYTAFKGASDQITTQGLKG